MAKDRRSKDQKRKAKLAARAKQVRRAEQEYVRAVSQYKDPRWVEHVYATEHAIYEGIVLSQRRLTNKQVEDALADLAADLEDGEPPVLPAGTPPVAFAAGGEVEFLKWNIRSHWTTLTATVGPVGPDDWIGILRLILDSLDTHVWNTGPDLGYVAFLDEFIARISPESRLPDHRR